MGIYMTCCPENLTFVIKDREDKFYSPCASNIRFIIFIKILSSVNDGWIQVIRKHTEVWYINNNKVICKRIEFESKNNTYHLYKQLNVFLSAYKVTKSNLAIFQISAGGGSPNIDDSYTKKSSSNSDINIHYKYMPM